MHKVGGTCSYYCTSRCVHTTLQWTYQWLCVVPMPPESIPSTASIIIIIVSVECCMRVSTIMTIIYMKESTITITVIIIITFEKCYMRASTILLRITIIIIVSLEICNMRANTIMITITVGSNKYYNRASTITIIITATSEEILHSRFY